MKNIARYLIIAASGIALSACKTLYVGLEHAKTSGGYVNSSLAPIGTLFAVDTKAGRAWREEEPDVSAFSRGTPVSGTQRTEKATSGLSVSFDGSVSKAIQAEAGLTVARGTTVELKNFATERLRSSYSVLNSSRLKETRERLGYQFADNNQFRFIFIYGVTAADDATFSVANGTKDAQNRLYVTVGGKKFEVKFQGERSLEWKGKQTPVLINFDVFSLKKNGGSDFEFVRDTAPRLNLTALLNTQN